MQIEVERAKPRVAVVCCELVEATPEQTAEGRPDCPLAVHS